MGVNDIYINDGEGVVVKDGYLKIKKLKIRNPPLVESNNTKDSSRMYTY